METIRNSGKVNIISKIGDGSGRRVAKEFLNKILVEFVKQSTKYINATGESPFSFRERQLHSVFAPAISKITDAFLMESPIERQWTKRSKQNFDDYSGWLDYWCRYRNVDFFIELKHSFDSFKTMNIRNDTMEKWNYMNNFQINAIKSEAKRYSEFCKGVLLVSLHVVTVYDYLKIQKESYDLNDHDKLIEIQSNYYNSLKPSPNWSGLWILNNELIGQSVDEFENNYQLYPGVILIAKVFEIIN